MKPTVSDYIAAVLLIAFLVGGWYHSYIVGKKDKEYSTLHKLFTERTLEASNCKTNKITIQSALADQNTAVENLRFSLKDAQAKWDNRKSPTEHVNEWKSKNKIDLSIQGDNCENDKLISDAINTYGY